MPALGHERASIGSLEFTADQGETRPLAGAAGVRRWGGSFLYWRA